MAIDSAGHVWVANVAGGLGAGYVTALSGTGACSATFSRRLGLQRTSQRGDRQHRRRLVVTAQWQYHYRASQQRDLGRQLLHSATAPFSSPSGIAIDSLGNLWVANETGDALTEVSIAGFIFHNFAHTGSFNGGFGVAIDSSSHVWVTNTIGNDVTALNNDGTLFGNFAPPGSSFLSPVGVAIDSSGNLWVANGGDNTVTELVGAAAPVLTPIVACLKKTPPATVCLP